MKLQHKFELSIMLSKWAVESCYVLQASSHGIFQSLKAVASLQSGQAPGYQECVSIGMFSRYLSIQSF